MGIESAIEEILKAKAGNDFSLNLSGQELTDTCLDKLFNDFSEFQSFFDNLLSLTLSENKLRTIPYSVGKLKNLKYLYIHNNELSNNKYILKDLKSLEILSISNNLEFVIPREIVLLKNLKYLFLDEDQLIRSIETLVFLNKNAHIEVIDKVSNKSTSFNFDLILNTNILNQFLQNHKELQVVFWQNKLNRADKKLKQTESVKATLDEKATNCKIYTEVTFLIITLICIYFSYPLIAQNWDKFEPLITIISALVTVGFAALYIINKQKPYWYKLDQLLQYLFERIIYFTASFNIEKYLKETQEIEKIKMNLEDCTEH